MTGKEIRDNFLKFFSDRDHSIVGSSSLVPHGDATLLFTNAGMVQFKSVFLGEEQRDYARAVSVQKCLRAGGKHNDLENVGRTARHHTFFEMLGNFSFGDYFKDRAIELAWEYLTKVLKLPEERLLVTIFSDDDDAAEIWKNNIGLPGDKIVRCGEKDNFWSMGDTGPCGPCSEIHFDQGETVGCGRPECNVGCDCDRYLEVWNLVFMQYNRDSSGKLSPLPRPSIDTGMGLERLAAVVQGKTSNFDTDLFGGIIKHIEEVSEKSYGSNEEDDISIRVIADHIRAVTFLISDGVLPANEGRGYVLRRIMRRAARHGRQLGLTDPFLYLTAGAAVDEMGEAYPQLHETRDFCSKVILNEEERFLSTLEHGLSLLEDEIQKLEDMKSSLLPGDVAFKLYDTYGFPLDLTEDILKDRGIAADIDGFNAAMEKQKTTARQAWSGSGEDKASPVYSRIAKTLSHGETIYVGYDKLETSAKVVALIKKGEKVACVGQGEELEIITDVTPFYGESGGQSGDSGIITTSTGARVEIVDTQKPLSNLIVHRGRVKEGFLEEGSSVELKVDEASRKDTARNHTATHLLHAALKMVLGDHIKQAGSLVEKDRLRFDLTHFAALSPRELQRIEEIVNHEIWKNQSVATEVLSIHEAKAKGATALFGEKYGDEVRVVTVPDFSMELCGGTHVSRVGDIGPFKIVSEGGIAAGVRRIEAITGNMAYKVGVKKEEELKEVGELVKGTAGEIGKKVESLILRQKNLEAELDKLKEKLASSGTSDLMGNVVEIKGVKLLSSKVEDVDGKTLRTLMDSFKSKIGSGIVILGSAEEDKVSLIAGVTDDLTNRFNAGKIIGEIASIVGGKGGGRADMAQAGGKDPSRLDEALSKAREIIEKTG
ncbi:MAG: alanine--tRNA ligase [Proteobacteria bacterium]|nr:alanine--tRNA ligase [Pseudomonadota bacterium]